MCVCDSFTGVEELLRCTTGLQEKEHIYLNMIDNHKLSIGYHLNVGDNYQSSCNAININFCPLCGKELKHIKREYKGSLAVPIG